MTSKHITRLLLLTCAFAMAACGSKKNLVEDKGKQPGTTITTPGVQGRDSKAAISALLASAPAASNLVASIDFNIKSGKKDITVDGKISMRRDEVIRIQLSPLGLVEVGRLEFTPDTVLIMDRMHKQFLKSGYGQVSFLRNNGIDFNALQALFWNQLFVPGEKNVEKGIGQFSVDGSNIALEHGKMTYRWVTDNAMEHITRANATYHSNSHGTSSLDWTYSDFKDFVGKKFPAQHSFTIISADKGGKKIEVTITMKGMKDSSGWDTVTKVPAKYKPVDLKDVINQIMKM